MKDILHSRARKAAFLVAVIVGALAATVYAYYVSLPPPAGPRVSITSPPLEFSIELNKAEFLQAENITMIFTLKNISNETLKIERGSTLYFNPSGLTESVGVSAVSDEPLDRFFFFGYSFVHSNGTEVLRIARGELGIIYTFLMMPSGYLKQTVFWDYFNRKFPLPSGIYQIRGIIYEISVNDVWPVITLETPTITIIIK